MHGGPTLTEWLLDLIDRNPGRTLWDFALALGERPREVEARIKTLLDEGVLIRDPSGRVWRAPVRNSGEARDG